MKKIILAGGSGFLGRSLAAHFQQSGYEIIILTRNPKAGNAGIREVAWDEIGRASCRERVYVLV